MLLYLILCAPPRAISNLLACIHARALQTPVPSAAPAQHPAPPPTPADPDYDEADDYDENYTDQ